MAVLRLLLLLQIFQCTMGNFLLAALSSVWDLLGGPSQQPLADRDTSTSTSTSSMGNEQFEPYSFTVNVDDVEQIAKTKNIEIERHASAEFQLNEDRDIRILGFVGHAYGGKTWLINTMFGKKLKTKKLRKREKDEHGLNMLYVEDGSWLIVDMLGSARQPKRNIALPPTPADKQLLVDQQSVEVLRYGMMMQLCDAIVFVIEYPEEYSSSWRKYAQWPHGDPLVRLSSLLTDANEISLEDPLVMVAHNFRHIRKVRYVKSNFSLAEADFHRHVVLGSQKANAKEDQASNKSSFHATFGTGTQVANFVFAQDVSAKGKLFNREIGEAMLMELRAKCPLSKKVNIALKLKEIVQRSVHHFFDGRKGEEDRLVSFTSDNISTHLEEASGNFKISINGVAHLEPKKTFTEATEFRLTKHEKYLYRMANTHAKVEAKSMAKHQTEAETKIINVTCSRAFSSLLIKDEKYLPNHKFELIKDAIVEDKANGQRIRTLQWEMPGVGPGDAELRQSEGKLFLTVTMRSRRPYNATITPACNTGCTARFKSGTVKMPILLDGWSFNIHDPTAKQLRNGIYTLNMTQEL